MRGDDVRMWQQRMRDRGWTITVDGAYGPQSEGVCREFQRRFGLQVDGIVGPITWGRAFS
jgi:peptidoglycan hydrolase-like protein with peptidoglycan-binding domain